MELRHLLGVLEVQSPSSECLEDNAAHWGRLASGPPVSDTGEEQGHMSTDQTQTQTLLLLAQCKTCWKVTCVNWVAVIQARTTSPLINEFLDFKNLGDGRKHTFTFLVHNLLQLLHIVKGYFGFSKTILLHFCCRKVSTCNILWLLVRFYFVC